MPLFVPCAALILYMLCDSFVWGALEWSQKVLLKVQCLVLFQLFYSSGWFLYTIVYTEDCCALLLAHSWLSLGTTTPAAQHLLTQLWYPKGEWELLQNVCELGRNLSFLGDDQGDAWEGLWLLRLQTRSSIMMEWILFLGAVCVHGEFLTWAITSSITHHHHHASHKVRGKEMK